MSACPTPSTLAAFTVGKLNGSDWQSVLTHVEDCGECQQRLDQFDAEHDPLIERLHALPELPPGAVLVADAGGDLARRLRAGPVRP